MTKHRKRLQECLDKIVDLPVEVIACKMTRSNHVKVYLSHHGETRFFVASGSPSDVRNAHNFRGQVSAWLNQKGEQNAR